jgi:phage repressor protein C with HTH and peptisase S24 domain
MQIKSPAARLRAAREEAGFESAAAFAAHCDMPDSTYRAYENGTRALTPRAARQLERSLGKPWRWLLFGDEPETPEEPERMANGTARIDELDIRASAGSGHIIDSEHKIGEWQLPRELVKLATNSPAEQIKILSIVGDSMTPTYNPVDKVMVDTGDIQPSPPGVFVIWDGLGFVVKRVQYLPHSDPPRVRITSDNPKYEAYERILGEAYIQGRVIGKWLWV